MPLIRASDLGDDFEDKPVKEGKYDLRITSSKAKTAKSGRRMVAVGLNVEGPEGDGAATIFHNVLFPTEDDDNAQKRRSLRDLKRFMTVFGINDDQDLDPDAEDVGSNWVGSTGSCQVVQTEMQDSSGNKTGEMRNELRLPRV